MQYVAYAVPLLCLVDVKAAIQWGLAAGLFIGCVYWTFITSWSPIQSLFTSPFPAPAPILGAVAWTVLLAFLARTLPGGWIPAHHGQSCLRRRSRRIQLVLNRM